MSSQTWTVTIPRPAQWINSNDRTHWRARAADTRLWRDAAKVYAASARLPALGKVRITATLHFGDNRRRDSHNYMPTLKAIIDGFVDYGLIPDDSHQYLIGPDLRMGEPDKTPKPRPRTGPRRMGHVVLVIQEAP